MKSTRLFLVIATLIIAGCATPLGPSDNFNDWTNSAAFHHYQQSPRNAVPTYTVDAADGVSGE